MKHHVRKRASVSFADPFFADVCAVQYWDSEHQKWTDRCAELEADLMTRGRPIRKMLLQRALDEAVVQKTIALNNKVQAQKQSRSFGLVAQEPEEEA